MHGECQRYTSNNSIKLIHIFYDCSLPTIITFITSILPFKVHIYLIVKLIYVHIYRYFVHYVFIFIIFFIHFCFFIFLFMFIFKWISASALLWLLFVFNFRENRLMFNKFSTTRKSSLLNILKVWTC